MVIVGALTRRALLYSLSYFKVTQKNMQFMLYEFKPGNNATKTSRNICCAESQGAVNHCKVSRQLKKFRSGCKNFDDQATSGRTKNINSQAVPQAIETKPTSSSGKISGDVSILQFRVVRHLPALSDNASRYQSSSSSSCRAACTDIPGPLSPLLPIVHRLRQVFRATSHILT